MIGHLRGSIHRLDVPEVQVDVGGVGYRVTVPLQTWDELKEGEQAMLWISSYIREDRFDLYGFPDRTGRTLYEEFLKLDGIGPKMAMELCNVPRSLLLRAVTDEDFGILNNVKGVGKKTAEKLLVELKSLLEKKPDILGASTEAHITRAEFDKDAISTLSTLGYDSQTILRALKELPQDLETTEQRVEAALRSL